MVWFPALLQGVTCGTTAVLTLHTADAYGNVRTAGGEVVSASHAPKGSRRNNPTRVKDNGNGTYALRCAAMKPQSNP
jgi:hypothetical protein